MVTVNGIDLRTAYGFVAADRQIPRLGGQSPRVITIPGRADAILAPGGHVPSRLVVNGYVRAATHAALLTALDGLAATVAGECVVRFSDLPDREWVGTLAAESVVESIAPGWASTWAPVTLVFTLPDRSARAIAETTHTGLTPTLNLGSAPSRLTVEVANPGGAGTDVTLVVVRVLRADDHILTELTWSGQVTPGQTLRVQTDPVHEVSIGAQNAIAGLWGSNSTFPVADPAEGAAKMWIQVTGGSPTVTTRYRRRWW